jgi:osmotically-inducible protein OsmY
MGLRVSVVRSVAVGAGMAPCGLLAGSLRPDPNAIHPNPSRHRFALLLLVLTPLLGAPLLSGCAAVVVGGAAVGAMAAYDRRGYAAFIDDQRIEFEAGSALAAEPALKDRGRISVTSYNYKVLLTGQAQTDAVAAHAAGVVSRLPKVQTVVNQLTVGPDISLRRESEDVLLTSRAKLALLNVKVPGFDATRVKVVSEDGVIYLLGLVSSEEGDAAAEQVSFVPGVTRVVKLFEYREPGV